MPPYPAKFEFHEAAQDLLVLTCHGGLSWEDRELLAGSLEQHLAGRTRLRGLILDMKEVDFVNSAGLGALFQLAQRLRGRGGQLVFANVRPAIRRLFAAVGMQHLARCTEDVPTGVAMLRDPELPTPAETPTSGT